MFVFSNGVDFVLFCRCKRWNEQDKDLAKSRGVLASKVLKRDAKAEGEEDWEDDLLNRLYFYSNVIYIHTHTCCSA